MIIGTYLSRQLFGSTIAITFILSLILVSGRFIKYLADYKTFLKDELGRGDSQIYSALTHCEKYTGHIESFRSCIEKKFPKLKGVYEVDVRSKDDVSTMLADIYPKIENTILNQNVLNFH